MVPAPTNRGFRLARTVSAAAMALGHGLQDAPKTMGVIFPALATDGYANPDGGLPLWVVAAPAGAIPLGTDSDAQPRAGSRATVSVPASPSAGLMAVAAHWLPMFVLRGP